jgi:hypothetical protein
VGASYLTTIFGVLTIMGDIGAFISHFMKDNPAPMTFEEGFAYFMGLATGVGLILAKSFNVTNSPTPKAAITVPPTAAVTANPAEVK